MEEKWKIEDKKQMNRKPRKEGDRAKGRKGDDRKNSTEPGIGS
jgi:hypothetical protein